MNWWKIGISGMKEPVIIILEVPKAKWSEISSVYKTRFSLARALVWKPKLLVFDEPLATGV